MNYVNVNYLNILEVSVYFLSFALVVLSLYSGIITKRNSNLRGRLAKLERPDKLPPEKEEFLQNIRAIMVNPLNNRVSYRLPEGDGTVSEFSRTPEKKVLRSPMETR